MLPKMPSKASWIFWKATAIEKSRKILSSGLRPSSSKRLMVAVAMNIHDKTSAKRPVSFSFTFRSPASKPMLKSDMIAKVAETQPSF